MIYNYSIAELHFRFDSDREIVQNGFASLFVADFSQPDITVLIQKGEVPQDVVPSFQSGTVGVGPDGSVIMYDLSDKKNCVRIVESPDSRSFSVFYTDEKYLEARYIFGLIDLPGILSRFGRLMLHSTFILYKGRGVLFCGKSGVGKSTQAELWRRYRGAEIVNGDKAVVYLKNGVPLVSSLPIAGTSGLCKNVVAPLDTVVFLSQGTENCLTPLSPFNAALTGLKNCFFDIWRSGEIDRNLRVLADVFRRIRACSFACLPDSSAVLTLQKALENKNEDE